MDGPPSSEENGPRGRADVASSPSRALADLLAIVAFLGMSFVLFMPGLLGRYLTVRDMPGTTLPSRDFWRSSVLRGELPVWNPLVATGFPTTAVPIHGAIYPCHLPLLVGTLATGVALTWALHLWLTAVGGYALARATGARASGAFVAGAVVGFGGYAVSMAWNGEKVLPHTWIPWLALALYVAAKRPTPLRLGAAAMTAALICLAGDPFLLFDGFLFGLPFAIVGSSSAQTPVARSKRLAWVLMVTLALVGFFAAPVLLPAIALRSATARPGALVLEAAELWSLHPVRWLELFVSRPLGNPLGVISAYAGGAYAEDPTVQALPWAVSLYVGAATFALAVSARGRLMQWLGVAAAVSLLLALGHHLPVHAAARTLFPPLALARYPEKHVIVAISAIAILAADGTTRLLEKEVRMRLSVLAGAVGLGAAWLFSPLPLRDGVHHGALPAAFLVAVVFAAIVLGRRSPRFAWIPAAIVATDLLFAARPLLAWTETKGLPPSPIADAVLASHVVPSPRIFRLKPPEFQELSLLPLNAASLYGIGVVPGLDYARPPELEPLVYTLSGSGPRTWELLRVSHLVAPAPDGEAGAKSGSRWKVVEGPSRPRAWMVGRIESIDGSNALDRLASADFDVEGDAVVASETLSREALPLLEQAPEPLGACDIDAFSGSRVELSCTAPKPSLMILADAFSLGWEATVDENAVAIMRVDALYRGLSLSPGKHRIVFRYTAPLLTEGILLSLLGGLIVALWAVMSTRQKRT